MVPKLKTRDTGKSLYANYLKRAEECYHAAKSFFAAQKWNSSAINVVHAVIAGSDALCIYFLGKRNTSERRNEAAALLKTINSGDEEINTNANRISRILSIKNMAEYEERLVFKAEAEKALKECEKFLEYVKAKLPR